MDGFPRSVVRPGFVWACLLAARWAFFSCLLMMEHLIHSTYRVGDGWRCQLLPAAASCQVPFSLLPDPCCPLYPCHPTLTTTNLHTLPTSLDGIHGWMDGCLLACLPAVTVSGSTYIRSSYYVPPLAGGLRDDEKQEAHAPTTSGLLLLMMLSCLFLGLPWKVAHWSVRPSLSVLRSPLPSLSRFR